MRGEGAHTRDSDLRDTPPRETLRTMGASGSDPRTGQDPTRQLGPQHVVWFCTILLLAFGVVMVYSLSLIHISEPTRRTPISYAVFCLKKKKKINTTKFF